MLKDIRFLLNEYGPGHTFEFSNLFYDYEQYFVLVDEFIATMILSIIAVLIVILVITSSLTVTVLVSICICMTDLFLTGLIYFWGLTFNPIVVI